MARFNSVTGKAALCRRGGLAAARVNAANGWKIQKANLTRGRRTRLVNALLKRYRILDADWQRVYGITLLEHLLSTRQS